MLLCEDITCDWAHSLGSQYHGNLWISHQDNTIRISLFEKTQEGQVACDSWTLSFDHPFVYYSVDSTTNTLFLLELFNADLSTPLVVLRYDIFRDCATLGMNGILHCGRVRQVSIFDGALIPNGTVSTAVDRRALISRPLCVSPSIVCIVNEETSQIDGVPTSRTCLTVVHRATNDIIGVRQQPSYLAECGANNANK